MSNYNANTKAELIDLLKQRGIRGYSSKTKAQLIDMIVASEPKKFKIHIAKKVSEPLAIASEPKKFKIHIAKKVSEPLAIASIPISNPPTLQFKFYGEPGLYGFSDSLRAMFKMPWHEMKVRDRTRIAKEVLKELFPTATRYDSLVLSSFVTPLQTDGGIKITQQGKSLKGSLIYEDVGKFDTKILATATKKVLEAQKH